MTRAAVEPLDAPSAPLWDELRTVLRLTLQIFGDPRTLLDDLVLPRAEARRLASWIASLEAAVRALLAVLAASLPKPQPARRSGPTPAAQASAAPASEAPPTAPAPPLTDGALSHDDAPPETPDSEAWDGVAFRFSPRTSVGGGSGGEPGVRRFLHVRGLAFRLEALLRVAAAPEPYARRLARRLEAEPGLARRALRRPETRDGRPPPYDDLVEEAFALAAKDPETG